MDSPSKKPREKKYRKMVPNIKDNIDPFFERFESVSKILI